MNNENRLPVRIYSPSDLTKNWFVEYYPAPGNRKRVYGKINQFKSFQGRMNAALALKEKIEQVVVKEKSNGLNAVMAWMDGRKWKPKTLSTYQSVVKAWFKFLHGRKPSRSLAIEFMTKIRKERYETTYNKYLRKLRHVFSGMGNGHDKFFEDIRRIKERRRPALYFQTRQIKQLSKHIQEFDPELFLFVQFQYYCFIRPGELRLLRAGNVYLETGKIFVPAEISKNGKGEYVTIPTAFRNSLECISSLRPNDLIFSSSWDRSKPVGVNTMYRRHDQILKRLGYGKGYTLYSWKHTGAIQAVKAGVGVKELQIQLRHHSLDQVNQYLRQMGVWDLSRLQDQFPSL